MTTTRPLQQNGHRAPGLAAALHYIPNCFAFVFQFVWLKLQSAGGVLRTLTINFFRNGPQTSGTYPKQDYAVPAADSCSSWCVCALDISSTIATFITVAMQPVLDRLGRLEASPAISSTDAAAVSVSVQPPAHGKSSIFWSSISRTIVDEVVAGQYVEIVSLLPLSPTSVTAQEHTFRLSTGTSGDILVSQQPRSGRKIMDLADWLEAWTNFVGIVGHSHPNRTPELVSYQHTILQAARLFDIVAVAEYDRLFHSRAVLDSSMRWDSVQSDLYTTTFNAKTCRSFRPPEGSRRNTTDTTANDICRLFNRGTCKRKACAYQHRCLTCDGEDHGPSTAHPIVDPSGPGLGRLQLLPHVTPVNVDLLRAELASHPDRVFVSSSINDMSYGARIGYTGPRSALMAPNLASADEHAAAISAFLTKECTAGRMAGLL